MGVLRKGGQTGDCLLAAGGAGGGGEGAAVESGWGVVSCCVHGVGGAHERGARQGSEHLEMQGTCVPGSSSRRRTQDAQQTLGG